MENLILGFLLGVLGGVAANYLFSYLMFRGSVAGQRVNRVKEATAEFLRGTGDPGALRNKYRYSLGVIIDDMKGAWGNGYSSNGPWPSLVHNMTDDRWIFFNGYVRPVMNDIGGFFFIGGLRRLRIFPLTKEVHALQLFCLEIENVVMQIDAAGQPPAVIELKEGRIIPSVVEDDRVKALDEAYKVLYDRWQDWLKLTTPSQSKM